MKMSRNFYLSAECVALFVLLPALLWMGWIPLAPILVLLVVGIVIIAYLLRDRHFNMKWLLNWQEGRKALAPVMLGAAFAVTILGMSVAAFAPERFVLFYRQAPLWWAMVMILYPVLSVYPQEIVFRAFFFHRYRTLFSGLASQVVASAALLGFVHVVYGNWIAVALSFLGGLLFSTTYLRTRSLLLVSLEHAILGNFIFSIGLGEYFARGA